jgi:hypothetical protein
MTIQRLLIIHLKLFELSTGNLSLAEDASNEELCESILYYKSDKVSSTDNHPREALQFAGLCEALYALPCEISPPNEFTKHVYLDQSTLAFQLLEASGVLAVAEISRANVDQPRGTPLAVRALLTNSHRTFCLTRGGGVHRRLLDGPRTKDTESNIQYGGMDRFYDLQKRKRKLVDKRAVSNKHASEQLESLLLSIKALSEELPIRKLREDLRVHYDALLADVSLLAIENFGSCRNSVEMLPPPCTPVIRSSDSSVSLSRLAFAQEQLSLQIQKFLDRQRIQNERVKIVAVSVIFGGRLLSTQTITSLKEDVSSINHAYLMAVMSYLFSFRSKMLQRQQAVERDNDNSAKTKRTLGSLISELFSSLKEAQLPDKVKEMSPRHFLPPPPLSLLSSTDSVGNFEGPGASRVWMPLVSLPLRSKLGEETHLDLRACLYDADPLFFLLLTSRSSEDELETAYTHALDDFEKDAANAACMAAHELKEEQKVFQQAGHDIIVVDREKHECSIYTGSTTDGIRQLHERIALRHALGFLSFSNSQQSLQVPAPQLYRDYTGQSPLALDARHLLTSALTPDTLHALDDAIEEVSRLELKDTPFEQCSFVKQRWVYAFTDGAKELYILFDTKLYATVAEVHDAASDIRTTIFSS